jgi:hypothetical protein
MYFIGFIIYETKYKIHALVENNPIFTHFSEIFEYDLMDIIQAGDSRVFSTFSYI